MTGPEPGTEPEPEPPVTFESYLAYLFHFFEQRIAAGKMIRDTREP